MSKRLARNSVGRTARRGKRAHAEHSRRTPLPTPPLPKVRGAGKPTTSLEGTVVNGRILLDSANALPDGTRVRVTIRKDVRQIARKRGQKSTSKPPRTRAKTICDPELLALGGTALGLPADLSLNLDHYLYGATKRRR